MRCARGTQGAAPVQAWRVLRHRQVQADLQLSLLALQYQYRRADDRDVRGCGGEGEAAGQLVAVIPGRVLRQQCEGKGTQVVNPHPVFPPGSFARCRYELPRNASLMRCSPGITPGTITHDCASA